MIGSGIYALSKEGRRRFDEFPPVIADDGYVRNLFISHERRTLDTCTFTVVAPADAKNLIKIKTRARLGNMELQMKYNTCHIGSENGSSSLFRFATRHPLQLFQVVIYVAIQSATRIRARRAYHRREFSRWERDLTGRTAA